MKRVLPLLLIAACQGPSHDRIAPVEGPAIERGGAEDVTCPAGEACFAPEVCGNETVVCPPGEDCFAPEICYGEERVFEVEE